MYDVIIIGAGPAGMAAAIYAGRAKLDTLLLEREFAGGQVAKANDVANYPGIADVIGPDLAMRMQTHAQEYGIQPVVEEVVSLSIHGQVKKVTTNTGNVYEGKTLLIATGATWRELKVPGEADLKGRGVSYCATCDGAFFNGKITAVVGGGNTGAEDAILLSKYCSKVYLVQHSGRLTAQKVLQDKLKQTDNIEILYNQEVKEILGEQKVEELVLTDREGKDTNLRLDGVFVAIGMNPNSDFIKDYVETDNYGYIITHDDCRTNIEGVFAAGDVRSKTVRQIITAGADGAIAIGNIERYFMQQEEKEKVELV